MNVDMTTTAAGSMTYKQFRSKMVQPENNQVNIFETHVIPPEDDEDDQSLQPKDPVQQPCEDEEAKVYQEVMPQMKVSEMTELKPHVIPEDKEPTSMDPQDELLHWHYQLGHLPFSKMRQMMEQGALPKRILKVNKPFCIACQFCKMTRKL